MSAQSSTAVPPLRAGKPRTAAAASGAVARLESAIAILAAFVALGVPWAAFTGFFLYQFYVKGSFLLDAGWFAFLASARDPSLPDPVALGGHSFFGTHISPIFLLTSLVNRGLGLSNPQFFALVMGLGHALPGLAAFFAVRCGFALRGLAGAALAAVVAILFAFNGLSLSIARYPHFEMLAAAGIMLLLVALQQRRLVLAVVPLALALATREDAGCHLFALLAVLVALRRWHGIAWRDQRPEIAFAVVGLLYSAAAVAGQHALLGPGSAALTRIYLGDPPFTGLTLRTVLIRLLGLPVYRSYLVLPAVVALIWAWRTRNPYLLVGYIAFIPWGLLQVVAHSDIAGTLSGYYAYPYLIAAFWPLLGARLDPRRTPNDSPPAVTLLAFSVMIAVSFVGMARQPNPGGYDLATGFLTPPSPARRAATDRAVAHLAGSITGLGRLAVDGSVAALMPNGVTWSETLLGHSGRADTVVYFADGYESVKARALAAAAGLDRLYRVAGTSLRIAVAHPIPGALPIAALLAPAGKPE